MFNRNTQAIQSIQVDVNQLRRELIETVEGLKASLESQQSLWSHSQHLRDRAENLLTRVLQNEADLQNSFSSMRKRASHLESIVAKLQDESVRQRAGLLLLLRTARPTTSDHAYRWQHGPLTGIRRELCPST